MNRRSTTLWGLLSVTGAGFVWIAHSEWRESSDRLRASRAESERVGKYADELIAAGVPGDRTQSREDARTLEQVLLEVLSGEGIERGSVVRLIPESEMVQGSARRRERLRFELVLKDPALLVVILAAIENSDGSIQIQEIELEFVSDGTWRAACQIARK